MKKTEETVKILFSQALNVKSHRTIKDSLTIGGALIIEDGCRITGKKIHKSSAHSPINFQLAMSEEDLHRLFSYSCNSDSDFSGQFSLVLADAIRQIKGARGKKKGSETTLFWIKTEASYLYLFFSPWCKKKMQEWPEYLQKLIETAKNDGYEAYLKTSKGKYDAKELAAYCIKRYYAKELKELELRPFDDPNNFYITYIHPSLKLCRQLIKEIDYNKADTIADSAIGPIFKYLKII